MDLPRYYIVGARPVKFIAAPGGGMSVLALDWETGGFVPEPRYLARCTFGDPEVDEVDEPTFLAHLKEERARIQARKA